MADPAVIDPRSDRPTWEGWGTSLAWWANVFGDHALADPMADALFTLEPTTLVGQGLPGLGMTIARYNVGACTPATLDGRTMAASPKIPSWKQIEGFWLDGRDPDPASASWDWNADPRQRAMLDRAIARGVTRVEFFSDSPLWWMCRNSNPSGDAEGGDNLDPAYVQGHARYLATVVRYAIEHWGIDVETIDPFNEPSADWWKADGTQEGCHVEPGLQARVLAALRAELDALGATGVRISASDESLYDQALATWRAFDAPTRALVDRANVHGYQYAEGPRALLYKEITGIGTPIWQSEYGDGDGSGLQLARCITLDLSVLRPNAFVYWQAYDGLDWGLVHVEENDPVSIGPVNPKYHVFAQYSRHIRPGMRILDSTDPDTVVAYDAISRCLVIVVVNDSETPCGKAYDLGRLGLDEAASAVRRWSTVTTEGGERYAELEPIPLQGKGFGVELPARSVQTFELDDVELQAR